MRSLPRSLDPLPDETLTGFVLRLAHRLGTTPAEILLRTGLAPGGSPSLPTRLPLSFQYHLDDAHLTVFARAALLMPAEVADMLLAPLGQRYGPLNPAFTPRNTPARMIYDNPWVLTRSTRYCPPCLTGNGTPIQDRHGGPWQRLWRLPMIFLCVRHRRLLAHQCPGCGVLAQSTHAGSAIARPTDETLNPRQCRSAKMRPAPTGKPARACGADLARQDALPGEPDTATMNVLLRVQWRLVELLAAGGPETTMSTGAWVPVAHYFADLRAVVAMIFRTWPEARPYASTPALAAALDAEYASRTAQAQPLLNTVGKKKTSKPYTVPPQDPLAMGAVLDIAYQLLATTELDEAREFLAPLVQRLREDDRALSIYLRRPAWISTPLRAAVADNVPSRAHPGHGR
ncbi:TniQ family protein [Streptomyces niveus]|uniref:TniQ family protein n=1 Tax=Streptomyces niveus TaxID=193462 RepID=UPI00344B196A